VRASCFFARVLRHTGAVAAHCVLPLIAIFALSLTPAFVRVAADGQTPENPKSDKGTFLVARPVVADPLFARSTVLMLPIEGIRGYVGLIVNKPTKVKLAELFPHAKNLKNQDATAYFGGPVEIHDVSAIFRSPDPPKHALHVFGDVYVTLDPDVVDRLVKKSKQPSTLRIFLGRSQWGLTQLQHEVAIGGWYSTTDNAGPIFTADPGKVWQMLFDRLAPRPYIEFHAPMRRQKRALYILVGTAWPPM
jgi:putative transcriptional regulator